MKSERRSRSRTSYRGTGPGLTRSRVRRTRDRRLRLFVVALALLVFGFAYWMIHGEHMPPPPPVVAAVAPVPDAGAAAAPASAAKPVERTAALAPLNLPADDAPHGSRMEWWYYNGILRADSGDRYAFHVAVFVANGLVKHTVMHVALTDLQTGRHHVGQSRTAGIPAAGVANGFDISQDGWEVKGGAQAGAVRADFDGVALALRLDAAVPVVAHRATGSATPGLLDFGASGISYYYSRPRMPAHGRVTLDGKTVEVSGDVWFDHQWGDFDVLTLGWNWFALHLKDGSDLMLYQLFDEARRPVMTAGTLSGAGGSHPLDADAITLTPLDTWTSPSTRIVYPVAWKIRLPSGTLEVKPLHADSEFDSRQTTANVYWEGPVQVTGSSEGQGFLELSGYDRPQAAAPTAR